MRRVLAPECSVVIPTYNAAHVLGTQLRALADQEDAPEFEVVVADNGSTDGLASTVAEWQRSFTSLQIADASHRRGVSAARNSGIAAATTDYILLCDADDMVSPSWVRALNAELRVHPLASGPVDTTVLSGESAAWVPVARRTDGLFHTWGGRTYGIGCNLGLRREVWKAVDGFDESYPAGSEEIDFAWRARDAGYHFSYAPDALVHYRIRTDLRGVLRQQYNAGRGLTTLYSKVGPVDEVRPKSRRRRLHHEYLLLRQIPLTGTKAERRRWLARIAFESGKVREAIRLGTPAP